MVIKEPKTVVSSSLSKLRQYVNLSDDTDTEISLAETQTLEEIVLDDDREKQKRHNEEALSMAVEKSITPLQLLSDKFLLKGAEHNKYTRYSNRIQGRGKEVLAKVLAASGTDSEEYKGLLHFLQRATMPTGEHTINQELSFGSNPDFVRDEKNEDDSAADRKMRVLYRLGRDLEDSIDSTTAVGLWGPVGEDGGSTMPRPPVTNANPNTEDGKEEINAYLGHEDGVRDAELFSGGGDKGIFPSSGLSRLGRQLKTTKAWELRGGGGGASLPSGTAAFHNFYNTPRSGAADPDIGHGQELANTLLEDSNSVLDDEDGESEKDKLRADMEKLPPKGSDMQTLSAEQRDAIISVRGFIEDNYTENYEPKSTGGAAEPPPEQTEDEQAAAARVEATARLEDAKSQASRGYAANRHKFSGTGMSRRAEDRFRHYGGATPGEAVSERHQDVIHDFNDFMDDEENQNNGLAPKDGGNVSATHIDNWTKNYEQRHLQEPWHENFRFTTGDSEGNMKMKGTGAERKATLDGGPLKQPESSQQAAINTLFDNENEDQSTDDEVRKLRLDSITDAINAGTPLSTEAEEGELSDHDYMMGHLIGLQPGVDPDYKDKWGGGSKADGAMYSEEADVDGAFQRAEEQFHVNNTEELEGHLQRLLAAQTQNENAEPEPTGTTFNQPTGAMDVGEGDDKYEFGVEAQVQLYKYGLWDAETQEATPEGQLLIDQIKTLQGAASESFNDEYIAGHINSIYNQKQRDETNHRDRPTAGRVWNQKVNGTAVDRLINNYNIENPDSPIIETHPIDWDRSAENITVTRNDKPDNVVTQDGLDKLTPNHLAGAIAASLATNASGMMNVHFLIKGGKTIEELQAASGVRNTGLGRPDVDEYDEYSPNLGKSEHPGNVEAVEIPTAATPPPADPPPPPVDPPPLSPREQALRDERLRQGQGGDANTPPPGPTPGPTTPTPTPGPTPGTETTTQRLDREQTERENDEDNLTVAEREEHTARLVGTEQAERNQTERDQTEQGGGRQRGGRQGRTPTPDRDYDKLRQDLMNTGFYRDVGEAYSFDPEDVYKHWVEQHGIREAKRQKNIEREESEQRASERGGATDTSFKQDEALEQLAKWRNQDVDTVKEEYLHADPAEIKAALTAERPRANKG